MTRPAHLEPHRDPESRPRAPEPPAPSTALTPASVLALQRAGAGNHAIATALTARRSAPVLMRTPTLNSMDHAWGEFTGNVAAGNVFSFIVTLHRTGRLSDGGRGFTWADFVTVIKSAAGKDWIKEKWRDVPKQLWGANQVIQGQHEWIKTDDVNYVITTVVGSHGGTDLMPGSRPVSRCGFRRRTSRPAADHARETREGQREPGRHPWGERAGQVQRPRRGVYAPPEKGKTRHRMQTTGEKKDFHSPQAALLRTHLNATTNDLGGFLTALRAFQSSKLWNGDIEGLTAAAAGHIDNDYSGDQGGKQLRGQFTSGIVDGDLKTTFEEAKKVADLQAHARTAKARNERIMENRTTALVTMIDGAHVSHPLSNFRPGPPTEPAFTKDPTNRSVADYDREAGFEAFGRVQDATGFDTTMPDDPSPDEAYSAEAIATPMPAAPATAAPAPGAVNPLHAHGGAPFALATRQVQLRFDEVNALVLKMATQAFEPIGTKFTQGVRAALQAAPPEHRAEIAAEGKTQLQTLLAAHNERLQPPYRSYLAYREQLNSALFRAEATAGSVAALQQLHADHVTQLNALLAAYTAAIMAIVTS